MSIYKKCKTVRDRALYDSYLMENPACQICGRTKNLSRHHIIGGVGRSDERCNLIVACLVLCHPLAEGARVVHGGEKFEPLTLGQVLAIKFLRTPEEWDGARLAELRGSALPEFETIPCWVQEMWSGARKR